MTLLSTTRCRVGQLTSGSHLTTVEGRVPPFVLRVISATPDARDAFLSCLKVSEVLVWRRLHDDGRLSAVTVFEVVAVRQTQPEVPPWNFLILAGIAPGVRPSVFLDAEAVGPDAAAGATRCGEVRGVETRRIEVLRATPNSCHAGSAREPTPFIIEYIAVHEDPAALAEYRETMQSTIGPALGELVREGRLVNMIALETVAVEFAQPRMPRWNQVHIRGTLHASGRDPAVMDAALRRANPRSGGAKAVFDRLDAIRVKRREDLAYELHEFAVR